MSAVSSALDDRIAMTAACTSLGLAPGSAAREDVLTNQEWNQVAQWLGRLQRRPADLLHGGLEDLADSDLEPQIAFKTSSVASRASVVALEIEQLEQVGIWTISRTDDAYPQLWKSRLKGVAPPVLFGAGPQELLQQESVAIVGSREIAGDLGEMAERIGLRASAAGYVVVSGGARGSDRVGMWGALQHGGQAVGVLPADLARMSRSREIRTLVGDNHLCLVSQVNPAAGFSVGNAMARNRLIYALSELTIVISTSEGTGGTWAGAIENLKRRWAPVAVWSGEFAPEANARLVERGALALSAVPGTNAEMRQLVRDATESFAVMEHQNAKPVNLTLGLAGD